MITDRNLYSKQTRYVIQSWVCDWGIYDTVESKFIGIPLDSYSQAVAVLLWLIDYFEISEN